MYPTLFQIGTFSVFTYGLFVALGFLVGLFLLKREATRLDEDADNILDLAFYAIVAAIVGSRIFYIATDPSTFINDPVEIIRLWNGGLVFYGGFIGVLIFVIIYMKIHKMKFWKILDMATPSIALGHSFGRIGCLFAGCCYGRECSLPWAITFNHPESLAPLGLPLHPTQIYASVGNLILFCFLYFFRLRKKYDGQLFCIYLIAYAFFRAINESFRGDFRGDFGLWIFSVSQTIAIIMVVISIITMIILGKRSSDKLNKNA